MPNLLGQEKLKQDGCRHLYMEAGFTFFVCQCANLQKSAVKTDCFRIPNIAVSLKYKDKEKHVSVGNLSAHKTGQSL